MQLQRLAERGLLHISGASLAANQLAWLILGQPLDGAIFCGEGSNHPPADLDHLADAAVDVFLAA
jgi:hypothetical protein